MSIPAVLQGNFVEEYNRETTRTKLSRPLVVFFSVCQLIFGFNFGFVGPRGRLQIISRFISISAGIVMIVTLFLTITLKSLRPFTFNIFNIQYISFFVILHKAKYTLYDFLTDLLKKTGEDTKNNNKLGGYLWLYGSVLFVAKITTSIVYYFTTCGNDNQRAILNVVADIPIVALDFIPIANFIIFYHVYAGLKNLKMKYQRREITLNELQNLYKEILDTFEKIRSRYDSVVSTNTLFLKLKFK